MLWRALRNLCMCAMCMCVRAPVEWERQHFSASSCALQAAILSHSFSSVRNSCQVSHNVFQTVRGHGIVPYICVCINGLSVCMYFCLRYRTLLRCTESVYPGWVLYGHVSVLNECTYVISRKHAASWHSVLLSARMHNRRNEGEVENVLDIPSICLAIPTACIRGRTCLEACF